MKLLRNLADVSKEEQSDFFKSFDHVLTDLDGVVMLAHVPIPGSIECIDSFKQRGKKVRYVTNNPLTGAVEIWKSLIREGFSAEIEDVANPCSSVISYLKDVNFNKKLFVVGTHALQEELRKANFDVVSNPPPVTETMSSILSNIGDDEEIGAVLYSWDYNVSFIKLQKAITYLKRKDCLFLVTLGDKYIPIGPLGPLLGTGPFIRMLTDFTGKEPIILGKPSEYFAEFIVKKFGVMNPKRVLFIGDQIDHDMKFANVAGYQKLLVLTGVAKIDDINNWKYPEEYKPEYYVESMKVLNDILKSTKWTTEKKGKF